MNEARGSQGLLMKNIMRLVVAGSIVAITVNVIILLA